MKRAKYVWLVFRALCELVRYEAIVRLRGFGYIQRQLSRQPAANPPAGPSGNESSVTPFFLQRVSTGSRCSASSDRSARFDCSENMALPHAW